MAKSRTPLQECSKRGQAVQSSLVELVVYLGPAVT